MRDELDLYGMEMNYLGSLTLEGKGTKYFDHTRHVQISDGDNGHQWQDQLTFSFKCNDIENESLSDVHYITFDEDYHGLKRYLYTVTSIETISGSKPMPFITVTAINSFAYDLMTLQMDPTSLRNPGIKDLFKTIIEPGFSGWQLNVIDEQMDLYKMGVLENDYYVIKNDDTGSRFEPFVKAIGDLKAELDAYMVLERGIQWVKKVDIVQHFYPVLQPSWTDIVEDPTQFVSDTDTTKGFSDERNGMTLEYRHGLAGFTRTEDRKQMATAFKVIGAKGIDVSSVNGKSRYILDSHANNTYNGGSDRYLEGLLKNENISDPSALLKWAQLEMKKYNHPAYTYEITQAYLGEDNLPTRGEWVLISNFDVNPVLSVLAQVVAVDIHNDNPTASSAILGEFRTLNPKLPNTISHLGDYSELHQRIEKLEKNLKFLLEKK